MADNVASREVQRRDDPFGIPACFYWTMDEVADWIESIGYGKYKENFRSHFINGRKLLTVDACVLPRMGITHFGDILKLCKHIRESLEVKRHLRDYNPWLRRSTFIKMTPTSGKKAPHLSFREHAVRVERIVDARLNYFKKRNYCYIGWSMEEGWDKLIQPKKTSSKDKLDTSASATKSQKVVGHSMQAKLRAASEQLLSYDKEPVEWTPFPDIPTKAQMDRFRRPALRKVVPSQHPTCHQLGQVNWAPVRNLPSPRSGPSLQATGYPVVAGSKTVIPKSGVDTVTEGVATVTEGVDAKTESVDAVTKGVDAFMEGIDPVTGGVDTKESQNIPENRGVQFTSAKSAKAKEIKDKGRKRIPSSSGTVLGAPQYRVSAIFHWKKMDETTGYPPLRLDKHVKCGYYSEGA